MAESVKCLRCHTPMEDGFIEDAMYGGNAQQQWEPGTPQASFWTGLKVDRKSRIAVTTMRCPKCGMLDSYARPE